MKVLVPIDVESPAEIKAATDAILDNSWPDDVEFYLFNVVEADETRRCDKPECANRCRCLEPRLHALCDIMRKLEIRMPEVPFYVEVARGNLEHKVSNWLDQRPSATLLTTRPMHARQKKSGVAHSALTAATITAISVALALGAVAFDAHPAGGFVMVPPVPVRPPVIAVPVQKKDSDAELKFTANMTLAEGCLDCEDYWRAVLFYRAAWNDLKNFRGTQAQLSEVTGGLSIAYAGLRQPERAIDYGKQSVAAALAEDPRDYIDISLAFNNLGYLYKFEHRLTQAERMYEQALHFSPSETVEDRLRSATIETNLGETYAEQNKLDRALTAYQHALSVFKRETPNNRDIANDLENRIRQILRRKLTV